MSFTRPFGRDARCPRRPRRLLLTAAADICDAILLAPGDRRIDLGLAALRRARG